MKILAGTLLYATSICLAAQGNSIKKVSLNSTITSYGRLGGISVDKNENILVANFHDALYKVSPQGKVTLLANGFNGSSGNTIDKDGNVYQAEFNSNKIQKIDPSGNKSVFYDKGLFGPVGITFSNEELIVCNCKSNSIVAIRGDKHRTLASGDLFNCPNGVAVDSEGNIYIVNFHNDDIIIISKNDTEVFATIEGGGGNSHIVFQDGYFYVSKIKTNQVYRLDPEGDSKLIAGNGSLAFSKGNPMESGIPRPNGVASGPYPGKIYIYTLNGEWRGKNQTSIEILELNLNPVNEVLKIALDKEGIEAAQNAFWEYKSHPDNKYKNLGPPTGRLAWGYMKQRKVSEALALFTLMSEAYPERWRPWYYLGEVHRMIGQTENALPYYERALKNDPANDQIKEKIGALK